MNEEKTARVEVINDILKTLEKREKWIRYKRAALDAERAMLYRAEELEIYERN